MSTFTITKFSKNEDLKAILGVLEAYAGSLEIDLAYQEFQTEMATMPGKYSPPTGSLLVARLNSNAEMIGCVALRKLSNDNDDEACCEIKRLYVAPNGRGLGVGKALALAIVAEARRLGYRVIRLDTLPSMHAARAIYKGIGFGEIGAYYWTPIEDTVFLELHL